MCVTEKSLHIRTATLEDVPALVNLERVCFTSDRLSPRSFRWMINKANALLLLAERNDQLAGYALILYVRGTSLGRIYSLAVSPDFRQQGVANQLMVAIEKAALAAGRSFIRLEVRPDNAGAIRLYQKLGYKHFDVVSDFYEDHTDAMRMMKVLQPEPDALQNQVVHYSQSTDFTCGPASLMMAMKTLAADWPTLDQTLELQIWREATTIFMTSGHGGCSAQGLALAANRRGFATTLITNSDDVPFINGVRSDEKKQVMACVHKDFMQQIAASSITLTYQGLDVNELRNYLNDGALVVALISSYRLNQSKSPHWVLLASISDTFVYFHDPDIDWDDDKTLTDSLYVPVTHKEFNRLLGYGRPRYQAAVILKAPNA
ncbi:GNAT family acetyltransferase [Methylophaga frappieri]|uniref:GNAT family acetyltransferase n=1 Tax=Methylophaga frappieri (strain ATCC BAA-2434 / DSM 25690 / JAM7) TaxID=754477 RepID=I1YJD8_METFJ|nr:GNAT family N-acetyltransferase/peptidase C39 family protein [Methylophaga frappieri]AFJ03031.1 GNAT family acetyltransferase [Methylophaga frappieri]